MLELLNYELCLHALIFANHNESNLISYSVYMNPNTALYSCICALHVFASKTYSVHAE